MKSPNLDLKKDMIYSTNMTHAAVQEFIGRMLVSEDTKNYVFAMGATGIQEVQPDLEEPDITAILAAINIAAGDLKAFSASIEAYLLERYPNQAILFQ